MFPDDDGMYVIRGRVDPEVGALLMRAIEAASDALYRPETAEEVEPAQRRADAIGLLAERALAAGFGRRAQGAGVHECDCDATTADPRCDVTTADIRGDAATTEDRRDATTADDRREASTATSQDAISADYVCVRCECLLCRYHHRLVHEGGYRVEMQPNGRPTFYDPRGVPLPDAPPRIRLCDGAAEALVQQNLLRGIEPDFRTSAARYQREEDIPWPAIVKVVAALDASTGKSGVSTATLAPGIESR